MDKKIETTPEVAPEAPAENVKSAKKAKSRSLEPNATPTPTPTNAPPAPTKVVVTTRHKKSRYRIGRLFVAQPTELPIAEVSKKELAALKADARLTVILR